VVDKAVPRSAGATVTALVQSRILRVDDGSSQRGRKLPRGVDQ
jgi:hypothetical protein